MITQENKANTDTQTAKKQGVKGLSINKIKINQFERRLIKKWN